MLTLPLRRRRSLFFSSTISKPTLCYEDSSPEHRAINALSTKLAEIQETLWKIISQQLFGGIWVKKV